MQTHAKSGVSKPRQLLSLNALCTESEPTFFSQANKDKNWQMAMAEEFNALVQNDT